jgi:hypothetical protein
LAALISCLFLQAELSGRASFNSQQHEQRSDTEDLAAAAAAAADAALADAAAAAAGQEGDGEHSEPTDLAGPYQLMIQVQCAEEQQPQQQQQQQQQIRACLHSPAAIAAGQMY